nr:hypothetical protein [Streptomyces finlayi]
MTCRRRAPPVPRWRYLYDPLGRHTAKQRLASDGVTVAEQVSFTWDGNTLCEQTTTSADLPHPVALTWDHSGMRPMDTGPLGMARRLEGTGLVMIGLGRYGAGSFDFTLDVNSA